MKAVLEMLEGLGAGERKLLLARVAERDARLAREIEERIFGFEWIVKLEAAEMQMLLRETPRPMLALALRAASEEIQAAVFGNLSARAAEELREEIRGSGPRKLADVRAAQTSIARLARKFLEK